jgi:hypothetical protein
MTVEKGLVAVATQMKQYVDEKDQIVLDIIQESNDKLNEVYDLVKSIPAGEQGPQGEQGLQGEIGPQGEKGVDGQDGKSITVEEANQKHDTLTTTHWTSVQHCEDGSIDER